MQTVLHIRTSSQLLGAERVVLELAEQLPQHGFRPIICTPIENGEKTPELIAAAQELGVEVLSPKINGPFDRSIIRYLKDYIKENDIDVVHTHGYREDLYALFSKKNNVLIATNHLWKRSNLKLRAYALLDAVLMRFFDHITAVSKPILEDMKKHYIPIQKLSLISNGINTQRFLTCEGRADKRKEFGFNQDEIVMGTISSLTPEKGINFLLEAIGRLKEKISNYRILIVGEGAMQEELVEQVTRLHLDEKVVFAGRRSDIPELLSAIDIFALPSLKEGLPMAMLEAMAAGKAVIASDVGDISSVITPENGILIPPNDVARLSDAVETLISNKSKINDLGSEAKNTVQQSFSSENMTQQYVKLYNNILNKAGKV